MNDASLPLVGVSRCLLGQRVRYDGRDKFSPRVAALAAHCLLVPFCPEVEAGMPVPREPAHVGGSPLEPRFVGNRSLEDHTFRLMGRIVARLDELARTPLAGYVFKSGSPSCAAVTMVPAFDDLGRTRGRSLGLFARAFRERFPWTPVADERVLADHSGWAAFLADVRRCHRRRGGGA